MGIIEIILLGIGLSMDALAVSICKGLSMKKIRLVNCLKVAIYFGIFHIIALMIGYGLGASFENIVSTFDHWIAFVLLVLIGCNTIKKSFSDKKDNIDDKVDLKSMLGVLVATNIDALAVGVSFAFINVDFVPAAILIGIIVFSISFIGVLVGNKFGSKYKNKAKFAGGVILVLLGIKILLEHLNLF